MASGEPLLWPDEDPPAHIQNAGAPSPFLILCDHAGRLVPRRLGDLGVPPADWDRHIAWDIGAMGVSQRLGAALDAVVIAQRYSRLVIDCNRPPGHPTSIPPISDGTPIPANQDLQPAETARRVAELFHPYQNAIAAEVARRRAAAQDCVVIAVHSFTPVFGGVARPWPVGILHDQDPAFGLEVGRLLAATGLLVGDNEPYRMGGNSDYTVPVHAENAGLPHLELEIRQDLIADDAGQAHWAALLARVLPEAWSNLGPVPSSSNG